MKSCVRRSVTWPLCSQAISHRSPDQWWWKYFPQIEEEIITLACVVRRQPQSSAITSTWLQRMDECTFTLPLGNNLGSSVSSCSFTTYWRLFTAHYLSRDKLVCFLFIKFKWNTDCLKRRVWWVHAPSFWVHSGFSGMVQIYLLNGCIGNELNMNLPSHNIIVVFFTESGPCISAIKSR